MALEARLGCVITYEDPVYQFEGDIIDVTTRVRKEICAMNIVVVDGAHLAGEADFPVLDHPKYGWQQFPALSGDELIERCWRADVIITVDTPIDHMVIDKAFKLSLIAIASDRTARIDMAAAQARGITVCHVPGADPANPQHATHICTQVIANITAYLQKSPVNLLMRPQ